MEREKLRIGIVGAGHMGNTHLHAFKQLADRCEIVAVCDPDMEKAIALAGEHGVSGRYTVLSNLLSSEKPDCVVICTPTYLHCSQSIEALSAGASVLCEKPMAMSIDECASMNNAAEVSGRILYIGFNHRYFGKFSKTKEIIETGGFGSMTSAVAAIGHGGWRSHYGSWFTKKELSGGGAFMTCGIHLLDMLEWYGFKIGEVSATMNRHFLDGDCEDDAVAMLRFECGAIGTLHASYAWQHPYAQHMRLNFERGMVDIRDNHIVVARADRPSSARIDCSDTDSFRLQADSFLQSVEGKRKPFVQAQDEIAAVAVALAAYRSHESRAMEQVVRYE